jgi:hypothetical protein
MATRRNGGIKGAQNRTTNVAAVGMQSMDDVQQSSLAANWPGGPLPAVPNAPAITSVVANPTSLVVTFTTGYNGGSAITSSTVVAVSGGVSYTATGSSPLTITGLSQNTTYTVYAYSTNSVGNSSYSYGPTTTTPYTVNYLISAGGGGGGSFGGGGAGGFLTGSTSLTLNTVYSITVGAGGSGSSTSSTQGVTGSNSVFNAVTSNGGGGGGAFSATLQNGLSGGSGGGGGASSSSPYNAGTAGSGTSGQGNSGGLSTSTGATGSGGGGGASAIGGNASFNTGGNGGAGSASSITGSSITYSGGGGGGGFVTSGSGGAGGGGAGSITDLGTAIAGTTSTGGGGGSGYANLGASGGSGVVILSIPTTYYSGKTTGSPTITTSGSNTIVKFTGNGSYTA